MFFVWALGGFACAQCFLFRGGSGGPSWRDLGAFLGDIEACWGDLGGTWGGGFEILELIRDAVDKDMEGKL